MKKLYLLLILFFSGNLLTAQTATQYSFVRGTTPAVSIAGLSGTVTSSISGGDEVTQGGIPIGFDFAFCGTTYTQHSVSDNGWISLANYTGDALYSNTAGDIPGAAFLMPFWYDLDGTVASASAFYQTSGTAPNRVYTFQWGNTPPANQRWGNFGGSGRAVFQIMLYESSNLIQFVYPAGNFGGGTAATIGIANSASDFRTIANAASTASITTFSTGVVASPANTSLMTWTPPPTVSVTPSSLSFTAGVSVPSSSLNVTVRAYGLTSGSVTITAPSGFQIFNGSSWVTSMNVSEVAAAAGTYVNATIPVRFAGSASTGTFTGNLTCASTGATTVSVALTANVTAPCTGTPVPGTVVASVTTGSCSPYLSNLSLSGATVAAGINYQWQSSLDEASWSNVSGATNAIYAATVSDVTYFRCQLSCGAASASTAPVLLNYYSCILLPGSGTTSVTSCGAQFYDNGGPSGNYDDNQTSTIKIFPGAAGSKVKVSFSFFDVEADYDRLRIYNGSTVNGANLIADYDGTTLPPDITSTAADGALSFRLVSDGSENFGGFAATISNVQPDPFTTQPPASTVVCGLGSPASLSFTPIAGSFTYKWYNNGTTNSNIGGTLIAGETGTSYAPSTAVAGTTYYYAVVTNDCGTTVASNPAAVLVGPAPAAIAGSSEVCTGVTIDLDNTTAGGTWSSSATAIGTVDPSSGLVTGIMTGTTVISYTMPSTCSVTKTITVNTTPSAITGGAPVCVAATITLNSTTSGGTWQSDNIANATVDASLGEVAGVAPGTAGITYSLPTGCYAAYVATVNITPGTISGSSVVCVGDGIFLDNTITGGTWSSSAPAIASMPDPTIGVVLGLAAGTADITYQLPSACRAVKTVTVSALPSAISGSTTICPTATTTLSSSPVGGTWTSSNTFTATVDISSGVVTGNAGGTTTISYTAPTTCAISTVVSVHAVPAAITGTPSVCKGDVTQLDHAVSSGTWMSSNISVATVDASGLVSGVDAGTSTIVYTLPVGCTTSVDVTVNALPPAITGIAEVCKNAVTDLDVSDAGGTWTSNNTSVATVDADGLVTGQADGTALITYANSNNCRSVKQVTVNPLPAAITGDLRICNGLASTLSTSSAGGTWSSQNTTVAAIDGAGIATAGNAGTSTISYTYTGTGCYTIDILTVDPLPSASTGTFTVCVASTTVLTNTGGGTWLSDATGIAQVDVNTGLVSGVSAGTASITYTLPTGCITSSVVSVLALPDAITGAAAVCVSSQTTLSSTSTGGTWSSANPAIAAVPDASSGMINGIADGTTDIIYTLPSGCSVSQTATVNPLPDVIAGPTEICLSANAVLTNSVGGGNWISSDAGIVAVDGSGNISGASVGSATITYQLLTGCQVMQTVSVNPLPDAITGVFDVCVNSTTDLDNSAPDGTWTSADAAIAGVDAVTGLVSGVAEGAVNIIYTLPTTCAAIVEVTVNRLPAFISGTTGVCHFSTTVLGNTDAGTWSSSNSTIANVNSGGAVLGNNPGVANIAYTADVTGCVRSTIVTVYPLPAPISGDLRICQGLTSQLTSTSVGGWGVDYPGMNITIVGGGLVTAVAPGSSVVTYTLPTGCYTTSVFTVDALPAAITGIAPVCEQETITLSNATSGGTWSSSDAAIATIGSASGDLSGLAEGNATLTYTNVFGCIATIGATVNPLPEVITGNTEVCAGLITDLENGTAGGAWSVDAAAIGSIDAVTGELSGIAEGTVRVTYSLGTGCNVSDVVTVHPLPAAIVGNSDVCQGLATTLTNATTGGSWTSSDAGIADIGIATGEVTGITDGSVNITYSLSTGCIITMPFTVNPLPAAITGTLSSCMGVTGMLDDPGTGGTWSSGATAIADIDAAGVVTTFTNGNAAITYTLPTGCVTTADYTVNPLPVAFTGSVQVCEGVTATLTNSLTGGTWLSSDAAIADVVEATGVITGLAAGTADVTYTLATGCMRAETITVNAAVPAIDGTGELCEGLTLTLTDTEPDGTWTSNDNAIATVGATDGVVTGAGAGIVTVVYTLATGCFVSTEVTVNALPDAITGSMQVCAGLTTALSSTTPDGTWTGGATGIGSVGASGIVTGTAAGIVPVTYTHTATGCLRTADVVVNALPAVQSVTGGGSYCAGGSGVSIGVSNSDAGVNYELKIGSTPVLTLVGTGTPLIYGSYTVAGTYSVQATNPTTGCTRPMTGSAVVSITPLVTPSVTMSLSTSDTVCAGTATTFTANPVNGGTSPGYQWLVNGAVVSAASSYTYSSADGDVVRLKLISSETCPAPDTAVVTKSMNVIANQMPTINITKLTSDTICQFDIADFSAVGTWGGIAPVYTWMRNGSPAGTGTSLSLAPVDGDVIACRLTSNYRCLVANNITSAGITLNVDSVYVPLIDISAAPGLTVAPGRVVTLTATVAGAGPAPVFEWRRNGVVIAGQTASVLAMTFNNGDEVTCMVYGSGTCGLPSFNIVHITVDPSVGFDGISNSIGAIKLTPNPNNGHFTITGSVAGTERAVTVDITDMLGQSVYHSSLPVSDGTINGTVTLSNTLANGMYMISVSNGTERRVFNFVLKQ